MSRTRFVLAISAALAAGTLAGAATPAAAAPMLDPGVATASDLAQVKPEAVRWVCGPYRCWWRPNYYGPRPWGWGRPWGWRRPGWGWHRGWRRW